MPLDFIGGLFIDNLFQPTPSGKKVYMSLYVRMFLERDFVDMLYLGLLMYLRLEL